MESCREQTTEEPHQDQQHAFQLTNSWRDETPIHVIYPCDRPISENLLHYQIPQMPLEAGPCGSNDAGARSFAGRNGATDEL